LDRLTRHQIKQDDLQATYQKFEHIIKQHGRDIALIAGVIIVVVGGTLGFREYQERQESAANVQLQTALNTFDAYVGTAAPGTLGASAVTYPTSQAKYKKALDEFLTVREKYPRTKAASIALIHAGVCEGLLDNEAGAIRTLQDASQDSNPEIASLARFTLAGELAKSGKLADAEKIYLDLSEHPTLTVPRATALMSLADAERATQPAKARQIYEQLQKEFGTDQTLAQLLKQQLASLPQ
jgi:hypothetical protein